MNKLLLLLIVFSSFVSKAQVSSDTIGAGNALEFNGNSGNYIDLGTSFKSLNFPFTFEAWVNPASYTSINSSIFSTDNDVNYCGFQVFITPAGQVEFFFGNDQYSNGPGRLGYISTNSISLNAWSHIAIVCNSSSDISVYINGMAQTLNSDGGSATISSLVHNSNTHAALGEEISANGTKLFDGQMDELRVWSISLSQTYVQNTMCSKIDPNTIGLLDYWRADESGNNTEVKDYTSNGINGTVIGSVTREVSDAPLGNNSASLYTSNFNGQSLQLSSSTGDIFTVNQISGLPDGVQLYSVNTTPFDTTGLKSSPTSYFGVFCINGTLPSYNVSYNYSLSDGMVNSANQDSVSLSTRLDATYSPWLPLAGLLNTALKTITKSGQGSPEEYAINVPRVASGIMQLSTDNNQLTIYPNPSSGVITISSLKDITEIKMVNLLGQLIYDAYPKKTRAYIDVKDNGTYFVTVISDDEIMTRQISIINKQ